LKKYKVWIYSGNTDLAGAYLILICYSFFYLVPITGTRAWIDQLRSDINMPLIEPYRSWYVTPPSNATA